MTPLTRKALSRRTFIRGMGATLGLPLLDAMVPAATRLSSVEALKAKRIGYTFIPMGADMSRWTPQGSKLDNLSYILEPLSPIRDNVTVISNLELRPAYPGSHATSNSAFLSAAKAKVTESTDYYLGTTVDQIAAQSIGQQTQLPSIELAMDMMQNVGQCDNGYACVYQNNLSWSSPTTPLPAEAHPRIVFEKLFGEGGTPEDRRAALSRRASLLDFVTEDIRRLKRELGNSDRSKVDDYLTSVREVERRIQRAEANTKDNPLPDLDRPTGVPEVYADHAKLMFDLQLLAMQGDITRVFSFQLARETSTRAYPEIGIDDPHHPLSHHGNDPAKIERMAKINQFHLSLFADFIAKLGETPEGNGTLLDTSLFMYGSGMGNPNLHDHTDLPVIIAGGSALGVKGNRHIVYDKPTPLANLHLSMMDKAGVQLESFGDSTGLLDDVIQPLTI
ncbi:MAG: DUF1552 domain-containing protein [Opitutaceae bacterium]|jgi:hypothetical protein|nr:DUF1552 domain-containing protein [Opitutaceae bacterium]